MYGPVPISFVFSGASRDFAPTKSFMMCFGRICPLPPTNGTYQPPVGSLNVILTVFGSIAWTDSRLAYVPEVTAEDSLLEMNSKVNATSSAENGWPSAHLTPCFSL